MSLHLHIGIIKMKMTKSLEADTNMFTWKLTEQHKSPKSCYNFTCKNSFEVLVRSFVLNFSFENLKVILVFMLQQLLYLTFDVALNYKFSYFAGNCKYALNN